MHYIVIVCVIAPIAAVATPSALWTAWRNSSNATLLDWSFAGYNYSESLPPLNRSVSLSAASFGVVGDGIVDDTLNLQRAINATPAHGVLFLPTGRYKLSSPVYLTQPIVLRGAGAHATVIAPNRSLFDVFGLGPCQTGNNKGYGWCQGFVELKSGSAGTTVATLTSNATQGQRTLTVSFSATVQTGDELCLHMTEATSGAQAGSMYKHFLGGGRTPNSASVFTLRNWCSRVAAVGNNSLTLVRPLLFDAQLEWNPKLITAAKVVTHVGVENLAIELPGTPGYPGHHQGSGYNALDLSNCAHCWVVNVVVSNADLALDLGGSFQCTVFNLTVQGWRPVDANGLAGHHGIILTGSAGVLVSLATA